MAFAGWLTGGGNLNPEAAFQMMLLNRAVVQNDRPRAVQALSIMGGGQLLAWQWDDTRTYPTWGMMRQGNNLFVFFGGTVNTEQTVGDITGIFPRPLPGGGCNVHSFFWSQFQLVQADIQRNLPADYLACNLFFTGQSYGSDVAFLVAMHYKISNPTQYVAFMGFATSKVLTAGYTGIFPDDMFSVQNEGDAIAFVPPNNALYFAFGPANLWRATVPTDWVHYERQYLINPSNLFEQQAAGYFDRDPTASELASTAGVHGSAAYLQTMAGIWQANPHDSAQNGLGPIALALNLQEPANRNLVNLNALDYVDAPFVNGVLFQAQDGGVIRQDTPPFVVQVRSRFDGVIPGNAILSTSNFGGSGMAVKAQFFFVDGRKAGISESWYFDGNLSVDECVAKTEGYLTARMRVSGVQTVFDYARFSPVPSTRIVTIVSPAMLNRSVPRMGTFIDPGSGGNAASDIGDTCLDLEKRSATRIGRMFLRGIPDAVVNNGGEYEPVGTFANDFRRFVTYLAGNGYQFNAKNDTPTATSVVNSVTPNVSGSLAMVLRDGILPVGVPPAVGVGSKINGRLQGFIWNKNLNGPIIVVIDSATTMHTLRPIGITTFIASPDAKFSFYLKRTWPLTDMVIKRAGERKVGRPTLLPVGRQKNRPRG